MEATEILSKTLNKIEQNRYLTTIINPSGKSFDWGLIINGSSGYTFVTGTVVNSEGNVTVSAS